MNLRSHFSQMFLIIVAADFLFGCQPTGITPTSTVPTGELTIWTPAFLTETPIPACVVLSDVELSVYLLSEYSVHIRITGLVPNENVQAIFSSKTKRRELDTIASGTADGEGVFEYSERLRGYGIDPEFKYWQIRVVHSRGSTCADIVLP